MIDGPDEIAQSCKVVLGTNKGEWFLNPSLGIDFTKLNGKGISKDAVREQIRIGLRQEPRIQSIESIEVSLDTSLRESKITFTATSNSGEVVQDDVG